MWSKGPHSLCTWYQLTCWSRIAVIVMCWMRIWESVVSQTCTVTSEDQMLFIRRFKGGANHPGPLFSTKLGKHMTTMSKVLNLKDSEMDDLVDFLCHDIRVHRHYYRLKGRYSWWRLVRCWQRWNEGSCPTSKVKNLDEISKDPQGKAVLHHRLHLTPLTLQEI